MFMFTDQRKELTELASRSDQAIVPTTTATILQALSTTPLVTQRQSSDVTKDIGESDQQKMPMSELSQPLESIRNPWKSRKKEAKKEAKRTLQKQLIEAAEAGDIGKIKEAIAHGADLAADINLAQGEPGTAINIAIKNNHFHAALYLMNSAIYGYDSVIIAIESKNYKLAKLLLIGLSSAIRRIPDKIMQEKILDSVAKTSDPDCLSIIDIIFMEKNKFREKVVAWVRDDGQRLAEEEMALIKQNPYLLHEQAFYCDIGNTALLQAIIQDKTTIAIELIAMDTERKSLNLIPPAYMANNTPLILALKRGNRNVAKALIDAGADVDCQGFRGFTALHWACLLRFDDLIELLLTNRANPQTVNRFGRKPLDYYITDITMDDLTFSQSFATKPNLDVSMDDINYSDTNVIFKKYNTASHSHLEPGMHNFATNVRDYSDLYWHVGGILKNSGIELPSFPWDMVECGKFNLNAATWVRARKLRPVNDQLIAKILGADAHNLPSSSISISI